GGSERRSPPSPRPCLRHAGRRRPDPVDQDGLRSAAPGDLFMIGIVATITLCMLAVSMLLAGYRLLRGPEVADRILSLDTLYINTLAFLVVLGIRYDDTV